ncbi:WhiB family transcriptional regulator [Micromonospora sp. NPDC020750]|uniref:WhiB family transcriptional regulator n=1 Tax=unclassified Micromonospora TaxID=2617518 RepID=UPI003789B4EF
MSLRLIADARPEWQAEGLCAETDPEAFFPEKGGSPRPAKKVCSRCDVQADCLEWALTTRQPYGIWGGRTEPERRAILRRRARGQAVAA